MLKALFSVRAWATMLVLLCVTIWALNGSSVFQSCINQQDDNGANHQSIESVAKVAKALVGRPDCIGHFLDENKDAILGTFTIVLALSTIFLWVVTRDAVVRADESSQRELRAYLGFFGAGVGPVVNTPYPLHWVVAHYKNGGQTPAHDVKDSISVDVLPCPLPLGYKLPPAAVRDDNWVMVPGTMSSPGDNILLPIGLIKAIQAETKAIYVWGRITYRDIFDWTVTVDYRYRVRPKVDGTGWELRSEPEGNYTRYEKIGPLKRAWRRLRT